MNVESLDIESHRQVSSTVVSPFPIFHDSEVTCGFGRGSSDLGIPTANISVGKLDSLDPGVYFGWCRLTSGKNQKERIIERPNGSKVSFNNGLSLTDSDLKVLPMVMSIGWNPFYENKQKAAEVHIMHKFHHDFYGAALKVAILGYMRPELNYTTKGMYFLSKHTPMFIYTNGLRSSHQRHQHGYRISKHSPRQCSIQPVPDNA